MIAPVHFVASTSILYMLDLRGLDVIWLFLFGNIIDFDHFFTMNRTQLRKLIRGVNELRFTRLHSGMHEPIFIFPVLLFSLLISSWVPLIGWVSHALIDHVVMRSSKRPFWPFIKKEYKYGMFYQGSKVEWVISTFLSIVAAVFLYKRYF